MPTLLLTVEETAAELRIARRRIFEMIAAGELRSVKIGKSRRVPRAALEEYVEGLETAQRSTAKTA
jgi:excisionase family DNA binding protein